jgi:hypothetical protein
MKYVCGNKYNNVIDTIKEQLKEKDNKNGLYINNYGLFQMLPVLYHIAKNKTFNKYQLQKIFRAILRFEVYKIIRTRIRKADNKDEFIKESLYTALGIDFEKYGTKLPELFEKKIDPQFYDQFHINKENIKEFLKSIGWTQIIPYSYIIFSLILDQSQNILESLKNMKEYTFEDVKEGFGINYDFDKFIIFNIVQSLIFKEKIDRDNDDEKVMKIIDSNNEAEVDNFLKGQVKQIYASEYQKENQKQIKRQFEIISAELIDKIINAKEISEFNLLMRNGITKGYLNFKISNDFSKGYNDLEKKILDDKLNIPLRYEKLRGILTGKDEQGQDLWNNGNALRAHKKEYQIFIQKNKPEFWEEICKVNIEHKYREKLNRQGHSNSKKSYWALGYETLQDFFELSKEKDILEYKCLHNNCCGLGDKNNSIKNLKKIERKRKRKEFRQKNKKSIKNEETKKDDKRKNGIKKCEKERKISRGFRRRYRRKRDLDHIEDEEEKNEENEKDEMKLLGLMEKEIFSDNEKLLARKKKRRSRKEKKKVKEDEKVEKKMKKPRKK